MGMPLTLKAINAELAKRGHTARLEKAGPYFYFFGGEAADWLDRTVQVPKISSLTLDQWIDEFSRLKERNAEMFRTGQGRAAAEPARRPCQGAQQATTEKSTPKAEHAKAEHALAWPNRRSPTALSVRVV